LALVSMKELLDSGVHFGHRSSRWNPKMERYIYTKRNLIHIIDLQETVRGLIRATHFLTRLVSTGERVLIVGTKRQARNVVINEAKRCNMPYVAERWLGGTLTNFQTIRSRLKRLHEIETLEKEDKLSLYKKKEIARIMREKRKLVRNLDGIRDLDKLPSGLVVIDPGREKNAVLEARKLGIPVIGVVDTNCDPDLLDIPVPANDDAMRSIKILLSRMVDAIIQGGHVAKERAAAERKSKKDDAPGTAEKDKPRAATREPAGDRDGGRGRGRGPRGGGRGGPRGGGRRGGGRAAKVHPPRMKATVVPETPAREQAGAGGGSRGAPAKKGAASGAPAAEKEKPAAKASKPAADEPMPAAKASKPAADEPKPAGEPKPAAKDSPSDKKEDEGTSSGT